MAALCAVMASGVAGLNSAQGAVPYVAGIAEQSPAFFDDPRFTALDVTAVRVVVPWDMLIDGRDGADARAWLARASQQDRTVLVALDHSRGVDCRTQTRCDGPSVEAYGAQFAALRARYPWVEAWTPWNEPNHASQPTFRRPELAAAYYGAARANCVACRLVAGDLLDGAGLDAYWRLYAAALPEQPAIVGLHDYYDATYFSSDSVDSILRDAPTADVWLTEVGGIVRFSPGGAPGLLDDPSRAADSVRWSLGLPLDRPRIKRVYIYQWSSRVGADFDAGLFDPTGAARPGYTAFANTVGLRPDATPAEQAVVARAVSAGTSATSGGTGAPAAEPGVAAGATATSRAPLRLATPLARLVGRRLTVRLACLSSDGCAGTVRLVARGSTRRSAVLRAYGRSAVTLRLTRVRTRDLRHRRATRVALCSSGAACALMRVRVRVES